MPAPATVEEFIGFVRKSGLVPAERLDAELARLGGGTPFPETIDQMAAALVRDGLLTRFQAKQLRIGRYKRFEIAGKYRLLELLGVGGMGTVYLCEHLFMKRLVAVKILTTDKLRESSALHRFYREAQAAAALNHPNIVRAYDIDKFEQIYYIVMEYVDGASLQEIVARHGPLPPDRAAHYVAQAAHGLDHASRLGLVHRDIKPGNLLLDRTGTVKILDMGLARFFDRVDDNVTERFDGNCVLGTADYLAPEQVVSSVVDVRADIYALGGSLYYMLTGQTPFPDGTVAAKLLAHQTQEPKPVTDFRQDVPAELLAILQTMMRKNPAERYQTPAELIDALSAWTDWPDPPPAQEMPELCPAVLALSGHAAGAGPGSTTRLTATGTRTAPRSSWGSSSGVRSGRVTQAGVPTATTPTTAPLPTAPTQPHAVADTAPAPTNAVELAVAGRGPWLHGRRAWIAAAAAAGVAVALVASAVVF